MFLNNHKQGQPEPFSLGCGGKAQPGISEEEFWQANGESNQGRQPSTVKKKKSVNDILRKRTLSVLFKVINLFNRKQTIAPFKIAEGKNSFKKIEILQQKIGVKQAKRKY